ncbi:T9SS type A sorting domain-containing protein [Algibacter sp. Ld11]|uniref:T9SS type A sorting domain-containing protein n=1 Tax=Algibacter sp. Ld11 TaxID=649150 RepID=UPI00386B91BB
MKKLFFLILMLLAFDFGFGQTTLSAGDIAITAFNSDNPDAFTFVLLTDILNTTTIKFTDNGWMTSGSFRANEGTITWTANTDLPCGTLVTIENISGWSPSTGSLTTFSSFSLNTNGDQILAYQGTDASPAFIYAVNFNSSSWSNSTSSNTSALPPGLTNGANAVAIGNTDNAEYDCSVESDPALILSEVSNNANWNLSNSRITFSSCTFSCSPCGSTVTWNGTWSGTADLTTEVVINADYNTSIEGSFQACSLIVSSGNTLTIGDATFVEVENDLTVEATASIYVASQGAFVQNEDLSIITNNGTIEVTKMTAPSNNWYEYTYWSSPVLGETIANGLFESNVYRRYLFKAENFLDATAETNNNNATVTGQDDFDDNGDDWERVYGTTVMQPGIGYASMHDPSGFSGPGAPPYQFSYTFEGDFNNGVITVPIHRNDSEPNDNNWNFVGNPYPSAIDADLFLATNSNISTSIAGPGYLNGAIFLWSQNTPPSSVANGNEPLNFSNDDFSIINASGETTGGDGTSAVVLTPSGHRAIPSGQGFFVVFSDGVTPISTSGDIATATVTFNNAMRVTDVTANSLFFKGVSSKNTAIADKLWINLTSDVGIYNQILISYINGATNEDDGLTYDATKYPENSGAALYSTIDGSNKKFAIQGKAVESINEEEVIHIGFNNYINNNIPYVLSIDKLQGDFLNNNTVYLKDNLLNIYHNLSEGDYNFTSETGEFQNRFEVVFKADSTLTTDAIINNESTLQIIQRDSNRVTFKTGTSSTISSIVIYDLFGRKLYQFKGANSSETFSLSNINTAIYLAQVELSTGEVITKKAIKR